MMQNIRKFFINFQLPLFFLLTYILSWLSVPFLNGGMIAQGPTFAALIILVITTGRQGLIGFWRRLTHWRAGQWYLVGIAIILCYQGIAFGFSLLIDTPVVEYPHLPNYGILINILVFGGLWEEPGWTGYALPKLEERFGKHPKGALIGVLILGVCRAFWHMPLFLSGKIFWFDILFFELGIQVIIAWLYHRSNESVPAVMMFHFTSNTMGAIMQPVFLGDARTVYYALFMGLACLIALFLAKYFIANPSPALSKQKQETSFSA